MGLLAALVNAGAPRTASRAAPPKKHFGCAFTVVGEAMSGRSYIAGRFRTQQGAASFAEYCTRHVARTGACFVYHVGSVE